MEKIKERMANRKNWPRCPGCSSRDILTGASVYKCLECNHTGNIQAITHSWGATFALTRTVTTQGVAGLQMQVGPYPQNACHDFGNILSVRSQEMLRDDLCLRYWFLAVRHLKKHGSLKPAAIIWRCALAKPEPILSIPNANEMFVQTLRENTASADCVAVFFTSDDPVADFSANPAPGNKYLVANLHAVGQPPVCLSLPALDCISSQGVRDSFPDFHKNSRPADLIYQPVDWRVHAAQYGKTELRLAMGFQVAGATNVSLSVMEDMDTGAFTSSASVRVVGNCVPINSRVYDPQSRLEDALSAVREKCATLRAKMESEAGKAADFSYEITPDAADHYCSGIAQLQELPVWGDFLKNKIHSDLESAKAEKEEK